MLTEILSRTFSRELAALRDQIRGYPDERDLWATPSGVRNSTGTLVLHLAGNLRHYVGGVLGGSGYVRDRDAEFSRRDVPRAELEALLETTREEVARALAGVSPATLEEQFPEAVGGHRFPTRDFLLHLGAHLAYHLGQVDYHRRLVTGKEGEVRAMSLGALAGGS